METVIAMQSSFVYHILQYKGRVTWFAKRGKQVMGGYWHKVPDIERGVLNLNRLGFDTYVSLNPTLPVGYKASKKDIIMARYLLVDIDPITVGAQPDQVVNNVLVELRDIPHLFYGEPVIVDSGRGMQLWLRHYAIVNPLLFGWVEHQAARLLYWLDDVAEPHQYGCRIDVSCSDVARVARCPDSVNSKTGRKASLLSTNDSDTLLNLNAVNFLPELAIPTPSKVVLVGKDLTNLRLVMPHLNSTSIQFLTEGIDTRARSRHEAAVATIKKLKEVGVPKEVAWAWVMDGATLCEPQLDDEEYIKRTLNREYG